MLSTRRYLEILVANILGNCYPPKISCTANTYFCYSHTVYTPVYSSVNESYGQFRGQAFIVSLHLNTCAVTLNLARTLPLKEVQLDVVKSGDDGDNKNYNSKLFNIDECDGQVDGGREDGGDDDITDHESKPARVSEPMGGAVVVETVPEELTLVALAHHLSHHHHHHYHHYYHHHYHHHYQR